LSKEKVKNKYSFIAAENIAHPANAFGYYRRQQCPPFFCHSFCIAAHLSAENTGGIKELQFLSKNLRQKKLVGSYINIMWHYRFTSYIFFATGVTQKKCPIIHIMCK
jgi:hypothetical protein